jgi:hypothetical protein
MSLYDYAEAKRIVAEDVPFDALIFAAMLRADRRNWTALITAFPDLWDEYEARFHAPGGRLPEDGPVPS